MVTEVTPHGVRDGEPAALAQLCERRGGAVLAFAEHVAAPGQATRAAADAFARFRAAVVAEPELGSIDADALLLSATRSAAFSCSARAIGPADEDADDAREACARLDAWLAHPVNDDLPPAALASFENHIADCARCAAALERFEAAERAYLDPPRAPLPRVVAQSILGALVAAAPVTALGGDPARVLRAAEQELLGSDASVAATPRAPSANGADRPRAAAGVVHARLPAAAAAQPSPGPALLSRLRERRPGASRRPPGAHAAVTDMDMREIGVSALVALLVVGAVVGLWLALSGGLSGIVVALIVSGVAIWPALVRWTYVDARRRLRDPRLVNGFVALSAVPLAGPVIYLILRPPETLDDAFERDVSIASSEKLIALLAEMQQTQREIHAGVRRLEQALHASRRRAAARRVAQAAGART